MLGVDTSTILLLGGLILGAMVVIALLSAFFAYLFLKPKFGSQKANLKNREFLNMGFKGGNVFDQLRNKQIQRKLLINSIVGILVSAGIIIYFNSYLQKQAIDLALIYDTTINQEAGAAYKRFDINNADIYRLPNKVNPKGLNFIFFADKYGDGGWNSFEQDVEFLMAGLKAFKPFDIYKKFNVYKIMPTPEDDALEGQKAICTIKTKDERKPVLRCDQKINEYLASIPLGRFKLIVLSRQTFQSWANVKRLEDSGIFFSLPEIDNSAYEKATYVPLFAHMVGHAFGLKDGELFVLAKYESAAYVPDGPNCAPDRETAERWWGDLEGVEGVGYFNGCAGREENIKPTQSSVMNLNNIGTIESILTYGPVSERYLENILKYCFGDAGFDRTKDAAFFERYPEFRECVE